MGALDIRYVWGRFGDAERAGMRTVLVPRLELERAYPGDFPEQQLRVEMSRRGMSDGWQFAGFSTASDAYLFVNRNRARTAA